MTVKDTLGTLGTEARYTVGGRSVHSVEPFVDCECSVHGKSVRIVPTLAALRKECGYSQQTLSEASGVSKSIIRKYEQGERDIKNSCAIIIYKLSKVLDVPMETIIGLE